MTLLINPVLVSFKMEKYARFAEINMIPITIPKAQLLPFVTLIYQNLLLLLKTLFYLINIFFRPYVFFFDFLIPLTTETTNNSCLFQFISALFKFLQWCKPKRELRIVSGLFLTFAYLRNFSS